MTTRERYFFSLPQSGHKPLDMTLRSSQGATLEKPTKSLFSVDFFTSDSVERGFVYYPRASFFVGPEE